MNTNRHGEFLDADFDCMTPFRENLEITCNVVELQFALFRLR